MARILVIGERMNLPNLGRTFTVQRWLRLAFRLGAFRDMRTKKARSRESRA